jgi:hypothetical protein
LSAIRSSAVSASGMRSSASARHNQRDALVRSQVVGLQESVETGGLVTADRLHQRAGDRDRLPLLRTTELGLSEPLSHDCIFVRR